MRKPNVAFVLLCVSACTTPSSSKSVTSTDGGDTTPPSAATSNTTAPSAAAASANSESAKGPCLEDDEPVCTERCKAGELESCVRLGNLYHDGNSTQQADLAKARAAWAHACDLGSAKACFFLGSSLEFRSPKDEAGAKRATDQGHLGMPKACDAGDAESCSLLADMYLTGTSVVPKDPAKEKEFRAQATKLYGEACQRDDGTSCWLFGSDLLVAKQQKEAVAALQRGCDLGDAMSCTVLADCYDEGTGVTADKAKAKGLFKKGCKGGARAACSRLK